MEPEEPKSLVLQFPDPRQQRIYEELKEVVGPGPAAFFHDACWLMANPETLDTTAHLVAHLLRELESAIRTVFNPVAEGALPRANGSRSQKEQIKSILAALNIEEGAPEAKAWFELADRLHGLAHRRGLDAPRSTKEIKPLWNQSQDLLDILVGALRERFLTWIRDLDKLLKKSQPTKEDLNRLTQKIPNNRVARQYFFDRLESPEWLELLRARGFFRNPPQPERNEEEGTIRFPPWPEGRYLAPMARHRPELVAEIIQDVDDTDNVAVLSDLVDALLAMPPNVSARLVEKAARWAESPYLLFPEKLGQLISHLAKGGKTVEAMAIARVLLDILPDPRQQQVAEPDEPYHLQPEQRARFDTWHYEQILKKHYPDLVREAGLPALKLLCDLLEQTIRLSRTREDKQREDYSYIWRPAIEDDPKDIRHTVKNALVSAVRDAAELLLREKKLPVAHVVEMLEARRWKVFHRIALHLLRIFADQARDLVATRLTDRELFDDSHVHHEYDLLMKECFDRLTVEEQQRILGWIQEASDEERFKEWRSRESGTPPSGEELKRYRECWQRDRLSWIGPGNLPAEWRGLYRTLVAKYGEPKHPEFPVYTESGWVGPTSPKTAEELKGMSVKEIVEFLKTWTPPENVFGEPSPEGLGRVLSPVVAEAPDLFASQATRFQGLDLTYVRAVLSGIRDSLKQRKSFDWRPVLELCQWVMTQPREIKGRRINHMQADPDWGWTRKTIADLLSAGLENVPGSIPVDLREKVWDILKPLTEDPDPTPEHEERYGGSNMDPATLSINTTRGEAMHAVVRYALWVRRHIEDQVDAGDRLRKGFDEIPEVREVLDAHLDVMREPSLAIRAVYGQWFPWLVLLDMQWARENAGRIFPLGEQEQAYFDAAWNTYVTFRRPYDSVFGVLREQYRHAVEQIGSRRDDTWYPDKRLAEHLMVFYWSGKLSLDDPLLTTFFEKSSGALRAYTLGFVGRSLQQTSDQIPSEIQERLIKLWEARLSAAKRIPTKHEKEMATFGWWFVSDKFDTGWTSAQLSESLQLVHQAEPKHMVVEYLAKTGEKYPMESVKCLKMIAAGDCKGWNLYGRREHVRRILEVALQNPTAKEEAEKTIHYLGSRGFLEFRNLLER